MIDVSIAYVRNLGKIPKFFPDGDLMSHLASASLHVEQLLAGFEPTSVEDIARVTEAIACYAMAYALPVMNTFYLSNAKNVPRQVAETDYVFYDAHELTKLIAMWKNRAAEALRDVNRTGGAVSITVI